MTQVGEIPHHAESWAYELTPAHQLPVVNVSVSVASRLLSQRYFERFTRLLAFQRQASLGLAVALLAYPAVMVIDADIGRAIAFPLAILGLPAALISVSLLCFDMLPILLQSFDGWYLSLLNASTLVVLGMLYRDLRSTGVVVAWIASQSTIFIDANVVRVRRIAIMSVFGVISTMFYIFVIAFDMIDETYNFALVEYNTHVLPATSYLINGLVTLALLLARNAYRKRHTLLSSRGEYLTIECVSYRCRLQLSLPVQNNAWNGPSCSQRWDYMKQMRYVPLAIGLIDARQTLILALPSRILHYPITRTAISAFGICSIICSLIANPIDRYWRDRHQSHTLPVMQLLALTMTVIYCGFFMAFYQRHMLMIVYSSFNFAFLLAHMLITSVLLCGFLNWHYDCLLMAAISNLWMHWAMCADALTPIAKQILRFHLRCAAFVYGLSVVCAFVIINYVMIFSKGSTLIEDRILWQGTVFGNNLQVRELSLFYNSFVTAFCLSMRLLRRLCTYKNTELVLIDGAVVYETRARGTKASQHSQSIIPLPSK